VKNPQLDLFKVSDRVFAKYFKTGLEDLAEPERVFICLWQLEAQVNNGGFHQFYFNSSGNLARDTVSSLQAIGSQGQCTFWQNGSIVGVVGTARAA